MAEPVEHLDLLYEAMRHPLGIRVRCSNPRLLMQKLYKLKRESLEDFSSLALSLSKTHPEKDLLILRRQQEPDEDAPQEPE